MANERIQNRLYGMQVEVASGISEYFSPGATHSAELRYPHRNQTFVNHVFFTSNEIIFGQVSECLTRTHSMSELEVFKCDTWLTYHSICTICSSWTYCNLKLSMKCFPYILDDRNG